MSVLVLMFRTAANTTVVMQDISPEIPETNVTVFSRFVFDGGYKKFTASATIFIEHHHLFSVIGVTHHRHH
jgi:hypothetical protein